MYPKTTYKIALVGDNYVGKTSYLKKFLGEKFSTSYIPAVDVEVFTFEVKTIKEIVIFCFWVFNNKFELDLLNYFDAAIIMASYNDQSSIEHIPNWIHEIKIRNGNIPMILCLNKSDLKIRIKVEITGIPIIYTSCKNDIYVDISMNYIYNSLFPYLKLGLF